MRTEGLGGPLPKGSKIQAEDQGLEERHWELLKAGGRRNPGSRLPAWEVIGTGGSPQAH